MNPSDESKELRSRLIQALDAYAERNEVEGKMKSREIKEIQESSFRREKFTALKDAITGYRNGRVDLDTVNAAEEQFFVEVSNSRRRWVLEDSGDNAIAALKQELLRSLREQDVYVLDRGPIENYYPEELTGADKPSKALGFCSCVRERQKALDLCGSVPTGPDRATEKEFVVIFRAIFGAEGRPRN